jgi:phage-related minor tail protein
MAVDGTDKLTGSAYDAAKAQAIQKIITDQGKDSMGAFGREADTAAGKQERMTAKWEDASAQLGEALLPYMETFADILKDVAKWVGDNEELVRNLAVVIGLLAGAIVILNIALFVMNVLAALNPFVLIGIAVAALIGIIIYLATQTTFFQDVWKTVSEFCTTVWENFTRFVGEAWDNTVRFIQDLAKGVGDFFAGIGKWISDRWNDAFNTVRNIVKGALDFVSQVIRNVQTVAGIVATAIGSFFANGFNNIRNIAVNAINGISGFFGNISSSASRVVKWVQDAFWSAFNYIQSIASGIINNISGFFGRISGAVQNAMAWVRNLFNMGGMPGWLKGVLGMGGTGFELSAAFAAPVAGEFGIGATGGGFIGSRVSGGNSAPVVNNYSIVVNGALDPVSVGKQLKKIVNSAAIRDGSISAGGSVW